MELDSLVRRFPCQVSALSFRLVLGVKDMRYLRNVRSFIFLPENTGKKVMTVMTTEKETSDCCALFYFIAAFQYSDLLSQLLASESVRNPVWTSSAVATSFNEEEILKNGQESTV